MPQLCFKLQLRPVTHATIITADYLGSGISCDGAQVLCQDSWEHVYKHVMGVFMTIICM